jgi:hypothetical protein
MSAWSLSGYYRDFDLKEQQTQRRMAHDRLIVSNMVIGRCSTFLSRFPCFYQLPISRNYGLDSVGRSPRFCGRLQARKKFPSPLSNLFHCWSIPDFSNIAQTELIIIGYILLSDESYVHSLPSLLHSLCSLLELSQFVVETILHYFNYNTGIAMPKNNRNVQFWLKLLNQTDLESDQMLKKSHMTFF